MSDFAKQIDKLLKETRDSQHQLQQNQAELLFDMREEITRLRAGLQKIVDGDGWWDAPSLARDLLEGKDVT